MQEIQRLLHKLSEGAISPEEEKFLFDWLNSHQDEWMMELFDDYRRLILHRKSILDELKSDEILQNIHSQLGLPGKLVYEPDHVNNNFRFSWLATSSVAAAIIVLLLVGSWLYMSWHKPSHATDLFEKGNQELSWTEHKNTGNSIELIGLSDGSVVWLYPESILIYPVAFSANERRIKLSGKAFFEVASNKLSPFLVISNEMTTKVLGTSFLVNAFESDSQFEVSVKTGHVVVSAHQQDLTNKAQKTIALKANESIILNRPQVQFAIPVVEGDVQEEYPVKIVAPEYAFREKPVTEIFEMIEKDYQIRIRIEGQDLESCALTTSLTDKSLLEKIKLICAGIGPSTSYTFSESEIVIYTLGCNQ